MKTVTSFLLCFFFYLPLHSQMYDNNWVMGYNNIIYNFDTGDTTFLSQTNSSFLWNGSSSVSDRYGNLLLYSDGKTIRDKNGEVIERGDQFVLGHYDSVRYGSSYTQGILLLPMPGSDSVFYFFHMATLGNNVNQPNRLFYSIIEAYSNNGKGKVIEQNQVLIDTFITEAGMGVCKHANGIDWWVIKPKWETNSYVRFLVKANGVIEGPYEQSIGLSSHDPDWKAQICFTIEGDRVAYCGGQQNGVLFDFDRCTGLLSNPKDFTDSATGYITSGIGVSFSPSGRFMYTTGDSFKILQYDTWAIDLNDSKVTLSRTPIVQLKQPSYHQLAPNGKIYIDGDGSPIPLTVINFPDSFGLACGIDTFAFDPFTFGHFTNGMPCFPHYRTPTCAAYAADAGRDTTVCDSLLNLSVGITLGKPAVDSVVYSWSSPNDLSFGGSTQPQIIVHPAQTATYILHIQDTCTHPTYSCTERWDTVAITVTNNCAPLAVAPSPSERVGVRLYPNPASDFVNVVIDKTMLGSSLIVTDVTGRKITAVQLQTLNYKLETSRFARGVYFIEVKTKDGEWKEKLVVE